MYGNEKCLTVSCVCYVFCPWLIVMLAVLTLQWCKLLANLYSDKTTSWHSPVTSMLNGSKSPFYLKHSNFFALNVWFGTHTNLDTQFDINVPLLELLYILSLSISDIIISPEIFLN